MLLFISISDRLQICSRLIGSQVSTSLNKLFSKQVYVLSAVSTHPSLVLSPSHFPPPYLSLLHLSFPLISISLIVLSFISLPLFSHLALKQTEKELGVA
jgi:hypothetical protein